MVDENSMSKALVVVVDNHCLQHFTNDPDLWTNEEIICGHDRDELLQKMWAKYDGAVNKSDFLNLIRDTPNGEPDESKRLQNMLKILRGEITI